MMHKQTEQVFIHSPFIKLDSLLKFCGAAETGGHAKEMVLAGMVSVDGAVCLQRGRKITPGMAVILRDGETQLEYQILAGDGPPR